MAVDHYNTLGVIPTASAADLRTAYLRLARANHPDKFSGAERQRAETRMQQINEAWNVLGVAHKRREYDVNLPKDQRPGANTAGRSSPRQNGQRGHAHFIPFDTDDGMDYRADIDLDDRPIAGSKGIPRWAAFLPVALVAFGLLTVGFGLMVAASGVFALGLVALGLGAVSFLMMPLVVMSRAERDPDL